MSRKNKLRLTCCTCGVVFECVPSQSATRRFCSMTCRVAFNQRQRGELFWRSVLKTETCWLWQGPVGMSGYGVTSVNNKSVSAHRFAFTLLCGDIPAGLLVCHTCDTPLCVRPTHLFLGTQKDNALDRQHKGRTATGAQHGSRTHPESTRHGEAHGAAKLTVSAIREIRACAKQEMLYRDIAQLHNVSKTTIAKIVRREIWRHIDTVRNEELGDT